MIPQFAILLGMQTSKASYGMSRLDISIDEIQFPDKTIIWLAKAKLADKSGAVGGAGEVNNHYGRVLLGAGLSALLSIGARAPFGSSDSFQPNLQQDFAKDVAGSLNRTGQQVVAQQLEIGPTITIAAGTPVTIQIQENISFQQSPTLVTK